MRIALAQRLTMAHGIRGGMETQSHILAEGLIARGHDLTVLTSPHPDGQSEAVEGTIPVRYIGPGSHRTFSHAWSEACYQEITRLHQEEPFDLLLSQSAAAVGYIPRAVVDLRLPTVVIIHGSIRGELITRWRGIRSARGIYRMLRHLKRLPPSALRWWKAAPMVDRWVAVSREVATFWQQEFRLDPTRVIVVHNGIDTARFHPDAARRAEVRQRLGLPPDALLMVAVGRLDRDKGFHIAIAAVQSLLSRLPHLRLFIAGEGSFGATLRKMAASSGEAIMLPGYVPNHELGGVLAAADLFLMPTLCNEGLPMTIIEALACGLPILSSRAGGTVSTVEDGRTGLLLPPGDVSALSQAIERLVTHEAERLAMGQEARRVAQERFSQEHMVAETERVLEEAIQA